MKPDPEAVRRALAAIDDADFAVSEGEINTIEWAERIERRLTYVIDAARAWLAAQDREETSAAFMEAAREGGSTAPMKEASE